MSSLKQQSFLKQINAWFQENPRWVLVILILLSAVLFITITAANPTINEDQRTDTPWTIASHLYHGKGYTACEHRYFPNCDNTSKVTAMREPVMVIQFFLAMKVLGESLLTAFLVEYLLFLGVMLCLYYLVKSPFNPLLAVLATFIWITYLPLKSLFINNTGDLSAAFWFSLGLVLLQQFHKQPKWYYLIPGGISLGLAILSRSAILIPSGVIVFTLAAEQIIHNRKIQFRYFQNSLILFLTLSVIISPWIIRNYQVFDKPMMTSLTGYNLFRHNAPIQKPNYLHYVKPGEANKYQNKFFKTLPYSIENFDEGQMNQLFQNEAIRLISQYPDRYLALSTYRFIPLWFNIGVPDEWMLEDNIIFAQQSILLILLVAGVILAKPKPWMYIACIAAYCGGHMAIDGQVRYLVPIIPLIIFVSMSGLSGLFTNNTGKTVLPD